MTKQQAENYLKNNKLNEEIFMDFLQDYGMISDNCITLDDVAEADLAEAWGNGMDAKLKQWKKRLN